MLKNYWVRIGRVPAVLALALLAACTAAPQAFQTTTAPFRAPVPPLALFQGHALAPASVVANHGAMAISNNGGGVISSHGASVVNGGIGSLRAASAQRHLLANDALVPLTHASARLVDASGQDLPGVAPAETDAAGAFTFHNVPASHAFFVSIDGPGVHLALLVKPEAASAPVQVDPATTMVAEHLRRTLVGKPAALDAFKAEEVVKLTDEVRPKLAQPGDLANAEAASKSFDRAADADGALKAHDKAAVAHADAEASAAADVASGPAANGGSPNSNVPGTGKHPGDAPAARSDSSSATNAASGAAPATTAVDAGHAADPAQGSLEKSASSGPDGSAKTPESPAATPPSHDVGSSGSPTADHPAATPQPPHPDHAGDTLDSPHPSHSAGTQR
jgi:hypothetical protein